MKKPEPKPFGELPEPEAIEAAERYITATEAEAHGCSLEFGVLQDYATEYLLTEHGADKRSVAYILEEQRIHNTAIAVESMCYERNPLIMAREICHGLNDWSKLQETVSICRYAQSSLLDTLSSHDRLEIESRTEVLQEWFSRCDSPLEEVYLAYLVKTKRPWIHSPEWRLQADNIVITQQAQILSYKADFLFSINGGKKFAVELDGHKYHSSREALARDKSRDRAIQAEGVAVLRFTYDEVWPNPARAVRETVATVCGLRSQAGVSP